MKYFTVGQNILFRFVRTYAIFIAVSLNKILIVDLSHDMTNQQSDCAPSEDPDQLGHPPSPPSPISLRCPHEKSLGP